MSRLTADLKDHVSSQLIGKRLGSALMGGEARGTRSGMACGKAQRARPQPSSSKAHRNGQAGRRRYAELAEEPAAADETFQVAAPSDIVETPTFDAESTAESAFEAEVFDPGELESGAVDAPVEDDPDRPLTAADLVLVYDDPRGLALHRTKTGDRWFATQVDPATGRPATFPISAQQVAQLKMQLTGSPYWVLGAGA